MECNALKVQVMEQAARIIQVWWHSVATHAGLWLRACTHSLTRTHVSAQERARHSRIENEELDLHAGLRVAHRGADWRQKSGRSFVNRLGRPHLAGSSSLARRPSLTLNGEVHLVHPMCVYACRSHRQMTIGTFNGDEEDSERNIQKFIPGDGGLTSFSRLNGVPFCVHFDLFKTHSSHVQARARESPPSPQSLSYTRTHHV